MKRVLTTLSLCLAAGAAIADEVYRSGKHEFRVEVIADSLRFPWALAFLPNGDYLVSQRPGILSRVGADGSVSDIDGVPEVAVTGQGGLLDVALDPDFADNRQIYLCYAAGDFAGHGTELARATLAGERLEDLEVLFVAEPKVHGGRHFGCRIVFDPGHVYLSLGDRGDMANGQDLGTHHAGVIRLGRDGGVPHDNPFVDRDGARPELFTLGNRNPQGMTRHPRTGVIWEIEHGPQGGDELNIIEAGANYGWPVVTHGVQYGSGTPIGVGTSKEGMADPVHVWVPSIAPSGMAFYEGDAFPGWRDSLFVGALKFRLLVRLEMNGDEVVAEERMLEDELGRIRDVRVGPDGFVYLLTDADPGLLVRLVPAG